MIDERISYDGEEVVRILESGLDKLNQIRYDSKYRALLGNRVIDKLNHWDEVIRQQKNEPLTIVVCGEFKRGKSSLINALLNEDIVTTDITTETITVNKVCYGPHSNEIVLSGGKRIKLSDDELKSEKLREILKSSEGSNQLILKRPNEFLKSATIIDTPGLGDSLADFSEDVANALKMADAVIYVFSIAYPLSIQEQFFIKTCILPQKYTDFVLVGNYSDLIENESDYIRSKETVARKIADIIPDADPILVSALDERNKQLSAKRPNEDMKDILDTAFEQLREKLTTLLEDKKDFVIPDRVQRMISALLTDIGKETDAIEQGLKLDSQQAKEEIKKNKEIKEIRIEEQESISKMIDKKCELYRSESVGWIDEIINLMEKDADTLLSRVTADDIKRFYAIFCVETLQEAFNKCSENFLSVIYDELAVISPELTKEFSFDSALISPKFIFEVNNATFTTGDKLAFAGDVVANAAGVGLVSIVTNYIGGIAREKEIEKQTPDYVASIKKQLNGLHLSVVPTLSKEYKALSERAKEQILAYFENEIQDLDNAVEQAISISGRDEQTKEEIRAAVSYMNGIMNDLANNLN